MHSINYGEKTLFWKGRWFNEVAPMNLWLKEFRSYNLPNGIVWELSSLLEEVPFSANSDSLLLRECLQATRDEIEDMKYWMLIENGIFIVKSFYNFLGDGGVRCLVVRYFWHGICLKKINLLN